VGLKREIPANAHFSHFWPQSNQRGIETVAEIASQIASRRPQSNQRGIETKGDVKVM